MGLLLADPPPKRGGLALQEEQQFAVLHRMGCKACPLNKYDGDMPATGSSEPVYYILGEAPGAEEIKEWKQFVGKSGELLRGLIPGKYLKLIRWNNTVRSRPPSNRNPTEVEVECCRPSIVADIERTRPKAIFGFGNVPLHWAIGWTGITTWSGRRIPIQVGTHKCWYYAFLHPSYCLRKRRKSKRGNELKGAEEEFLGFQLRQAFEEVEQLKPADPHTRERALAGVECLYDIKSIEAALEYMKTVPVAGIDYETNCRRPYEKGAKILSIGVSDGERSVSFPYDHPFAKWTVEERQRLTELWCDFLAKAKGVRAVHSLAFELEWTGEMFGREFVRAGDWHDTGGQAVVLDERTGEMKPGPLSLEFLCQQHFGINIKAIAGVDRSNLARVPLDRVLPYNAVDAKYHALLWVKQNHLLRRQKLEEAYRLQLRRVPTVVLTQLKGAPVDQTVVRSLQDRYHKEITVLENQIDEDETSKKFYRAKGYKFNPYSAPNCIELFARMLKCEECHVIDKKTKQPKVSANEKVLSRLVDRYPLAQLILDLRSVNKTKSYVDSMSEGSEVLYPDGQLHTVFNTYFAETGRLTSDSPNLQNFPKRDEEARIVRSAIKSPPGHVCLAVDYGQIEARVAAMFTHDPKYTRMLWERYDIHTDWAERIAYAYPRRVGGKEYLKDKKVMKTFRTDIKNQWTFPLIFNASLPSIAGYLNIPIDVLTPFYDEFWEEYEEIHRWQKKNKDFYQKYGYVECLTGRRRHGPLTGNQICNTPIQGTAAEIVLDAMARLSETGDWDLQPEINIHDDLTYIRIRKDKFDETAEKIIGMMLDVPWDWAKVVPISVEAAVGPDWGNVQVPKDERGQDIVYFSDEWFGWKPPAWL